MSPEEMKMRIDFLEQKVILLGEFIDKQSNLNLTVTEQMEIHRKSLVELIEAANKFRDSGQELVQQDLRLLSMINAVKKYLEVQQKSISSFFNDYVENVSKLTAISTLDVIRRIEDNSGKENISKTKLFVVRDEIAPTE